MLKASELQFGEHSIADLVERNAVLAYEVFQHGHCILLLAAYSLLSELGNSPLPAYLRFMG
ncbi:hypothetical protein AWB61_20630 [Chromobacterium sp. F49]|nr:hypothetical protein Cv017_15990 [Chromobacterium subtsugae]KZE85296.1 hypothetical protein AWB61_20630 [Chromobacterium sp. F49]